MSIIMRIETRVGGGPRFMTMFHGTPSGGGLGAPAPQHPLRVRVCQQALGRKEGGSCHVSNRVQNGTWTSAHCLEIEHALRQADRDAACGIRHR